MQQFIEKLSGRQVLTRSEAEAALRLIAGGTLPAEQIAAFLTCYRTREVTSEEFLGFRSVMLELAMPFHSTVPMIDTCGTGGDGKDTFNISTATAFLLAACGVVVAKHGNYSASSVCGSSNVLEVLRVPFAKNEADALQQLNSCNLTFLHAPIWHPAMKAVAAVRKQLGFKTIFNLLGPIVNPAQPRYQLLGVTTLAHQRLYAETLQNTAVDFAVVCDEAGYDEISLTAPAVVQTRKGPSQIFPEDFGATWLKASDLQCENSVTAYAECLEAILGGRGTKAQTAVVAANAAIALSLIREDQSLKSLYDQTLKKLEEGAPAKILSQLRGVA